jgi:hypothetical protein
VDSAKLKQIIFNGKPKRIYKTNRDAQMSYQDPKRVHTALREFNDLSANKIFQRILDQVIEMENEKKGGADFKRRHTVNVSQADKGALEGLARAAT